MITADAGTDANNVGFIVIEDNSMLNGAVTIAQTVNADGNYEIRMNSDIEHRPAVTELVTAFNTALSGSFTAVANDPLITSVSSAGDGQITNGVNTVGGKDAIVATVTINTGNSNSLHLEASTAGAAGNNIRVALVEDTSLAINEAIIDQPSGTNDNAYLIRYNISFNSVGTLRSVLNSALTNVNSDGDTSNDVPFEVGTVDNGNPEINTDVAAAAFTRGADEVIAVPETTTAEWQFRGIYIQADASGETGTFGSTTINYNKISFVLGSSPIEGGVGVLLPGGTDPDVTINYDITGDDATTVQDVVNAINCHGNLNQLVTASYKVPDGETAAVKLSGGTSVSGSYTIDDEDTTDTLDAHTLTLQVREGTNGVYTDVTSGG